MPGGPPAYTNAMLSTTLKDLESYGLVDRIQYNEVPPRVEYSLTANGRAIAPAFLEFERWGQRLLDAKETAEGGVADNAADGTADDTNDAS